MPNETIQRIVDAMEVRFHHAHVYEVKKPFTILGTPQNMSILFKPLQGTYTWGKDHKNLPTDWFYLIPKGQLNTTQMGGTSGPVLDPVFMSNPANPIRMEYMQSLKYGENYSKSSIIAASMGFELLVHGVVNIFQVMGLPLLVMPPNEDMNNAFNGVLKETAHNDIGSSTLRKKYMEEIMILMMRQLYVREDLKEIMAKLNYLLDRRLIDVVEYVQTNLEGDLSNVKIAQVACVTKDYVGQFFKSLTGRNLQDYIEERRLERAYYLIRTTDENIQQIAVRVGFKDPAYFSRRFKMKFNINAKEVRKPELLAV